MNQSPEKAPRNRVDVLNFLRVAATLIVFFLHGRSFVPGMDGANKIVRILSLQPAWAGVWILFFLSGYLMQRGFDAGRYAVIGAEKPFRAYVQFCLRRFLKIAPPYYLFVLLFFVLRGEPFFVTDWRVIVKMLTFTFNGQGGVDGIGHLWYLSPAMWLYFLSPLLAFCIEKSRRWLKGAFLPLILAGVIAGGYFLRNGMNNAGMDWYVWIYSSLIGNLDLFIGGMLLSAITFDHRSTGTFRKILKILPALLFPALCLWNCYVYYREDYDLYRLVFPTLYLIVCSLLCFAFDGDATVRSKPTGKAILKNPLRLIDAFSPYTYAFYIFHVAVFLCVSASLGTLSWYQQLTPSYAWLVFFCVCFPVNLVLAVVYTNFFRQKKPKSA